MSHVLATCCSACSPSTGGGRKRHSEDLASGGTALSRLVDIIRQVVREELRGTHRDAGDPWLTRSEAAALVSCSARSLDRYRAEGLLRAPVLLNGSPRWRRSWVEADLLTRRNRRRKPGGRPAAVKAAGMDEIGGTINDPTTSG